MQKTLASSFRLSENDGVYALGNRFTYDMSLSVNTNMCDMVSIAGDADNDVKLTFKGNKIKATGVDTESGIVTVFSNIVDMETYSYTTGYDFFVVSSSASGKAGDINILGSSKNNGIFDTNIGSHSSDTEKPTGKIGDVNRDGVIGADDARLALRRSVDLEDYPEDSPEFLACDVNGDKSIGADDARLILRASVDLEDLSNYAPAT
ncbi:MAG: hypothetical protein IJK02_04345 [Clostridia bacterium]|nr:hypothetical protein [Clostridia bacterium]